MKIDGGFGNAGREIPGIRRHSDSHPGESLIRVHQTPRHVTVYSDVHPYFDHAPDQYACTDRYSMIIPFVKGADKRRSAHSEIHHIRLLIQSANTLIQCISRMVN